MKKTPLARVKEQFQSKESLVAAVKELATDALWLDRVSGAKGLQRVSNAKLLRLYDVLSAAKKEFGSRDKLVGAILDLEKRSKDAGYKTRLERYTLPRLLDLQRASSRRSKRAELRAKARALLAPKKKPSAAKKSKSKSKSSEARAS